MSGSCLVCASLLLAAAGSAPDREPLALRVENFTVPPSSGPLVHVRVCNRRDAPCDATVSIRLPEGWRVNTSEQAVRLRPRETRRLDFAIEKARDNLRNEYRVAVAAEVGARRVVRHQAVVCASAPYLEPRIDGKANEWADALPVSFITGGKRTTLRTYWNHDALCLLVEVEENKLRSRRRKPSDRADAVQVAIAPAGSTTGARPSAKATRHEFLLVAAPSWFSRSRCYRLMRPGTPLAVAAQERDLKGMECRQVRLAVRRRKGVTSYECAIPFGLMPEIRPSEGREFSLSLVVHDPDGTGLREWGAAAGLWPWQRNPLAWCRWQGDSRGPEAPFDSKTEWGLCSSRH